MKVSLSVFMDDGAAALAADDLMIRLVRSYFGEPPSLLAPRLRERRYIRQLLPIQRDLFRRFQPQHATAAGGIGLRVVFGIVEGVGFHGHAAAVLQHDGLVYVIVGDP